MCQRCGSPYTFSNCGCNKSTYHSCPPPCPPPCPDNGCPIHLDFKCVLYHKDNNELSKLTNLGLTNGATLQLFAETVDDKFGQINALNYNLPCLRTDYTISNLKQFAEAVDTELCILKDTIGSITVPAIVANDSSTIDFTASGTLNHTITAAVKLSTTSPNLISTLSDGLYVAPQTLSVNAAAKELTISNGNTVSLASITCGASGFLGNLATDPSVSSDGQYWYNTTSGQLKIKLNGTVRQIQIV